MAWSVSFSDLSELSCNFMLLGATKSGVSDETKIDYSFRSNLAMFSCWRKSVKAMELSNSRSCETSYDFSSFYEFRSYPCRL